MEVDALEVASEMVLLMEVVVADGENGRADLPAGTWQVTLWVRRRKSVAKSNDRSKSETNKRICHWSKRLQPIVCGKVRLK